MKELKLSYSEVAREVGVKQPTISRLVKGEQYSTTRIRRLAEVLKTTPAYLEGVTDDPDEGAPPPPPAPTVQYVMMPIGLPPERALEQMFEGLLEGLDPEHPDEHALLLARRLPSALAQLKDLLPASLPVTGAKPRRRRPTPIAAPSS